MALASLLSSGLMTSDLRENLLVRLKFEIISMNYCHSFLYCVMHVLNANIRAYNLYMGLRKLYHLCFVVYTCICILYIPGTVEHYTKLTQLFLFCFLILTYSTNILYLRLQLKEEENCKEKQLWVALYFSFLLCHNFLV